MSVKGYNDAQSYRLHKEIHERCKDWSSTRILPPSPSFLHPFCVTHNRGTFLREVSVQFWGSSLEAIEVAIPRDTKKECIFKMSYWQFSHISQGMKNGCATIEDKVRNVVCMCTPSNIGMNLFFGYGVDTVHWKNIE